MDSIATTAGTSVDGRTPLATAISHDETMGEEGAESKPTYKSFKKKFKKMKKRFDDAMKQSNELYLQEQQALRVAKRIATENDKTLDCLLHQNDHPQIPNDKRYNLTSETPALSAVPSLIADDELSKGAELHTEEGRAIYADIRSMLEERQTTIANPTNGKSIAEMMAAIPHLTSTHPEVSQELLESLEPAEGHASPYSYLTLEQIDDYLWDSDALLGLVHPVPHAPQEAAVFGHPHSPYNWLRRNVPQIFLQDGEGSEKSNGKPGALRGAGKRSSIPAPSRPDALEIVEEDGIGYEFATGGAASTKGKRKRDEDDTGYHPKSGAKKPRQPRKKKGEGEEGKPEGKPASARKKKPKIPSPPPGAHPFGPM